MALFPGQGASAWTYRRDIQSITQVNVPAFVAVSLVGGLIGALLLLFTSNEAFARLVPFLMLFATAVFAWGNLSSPAALKRYTLGPTAVLATQFAISVYGGYFGGGIGFLMLAALTLFGLRDIHAMNGLKILLATLMNGAAVVAFAGAGIVRWPETIAMALAGIAGGVLGAKGAKQVNPRAHQARHPGARRRADRLLLLEAIRRGGLSPPARLRNERRPQAPFLVPTSLRASAATLVHHAPHRGHERRAERGLERRGGEERDHADQPGLFGADRRREPAEAEGEDRQVAQRHRRPMPTRERPSPRSHSTPTR